MDVSYFDNTTFFQFTEDLLPQVTKTLCPMSPSARGLVACLAVRLLFKSTKHNDFYPV